MKILTYLHWGGFPHWNRPQLSTDYGIFDRNGFEYPTTTLLTVFGFGLCIFDLDDECPAPQFCWRRGYVLKGLSFGIFKIQKRQAPATFNPARI